MSDNIELNPGAGGAIAATDDVSGVHYQIVKLDLGGNGASLPVVGAIPVSGSVTVSNFPATQSVSVEELPLPAGAATQATLATVASVVRAEDSPHTSGDAGLVMLCMREDSDVPTAASGDYSILKLDEAGRLKVSTQPASYADGTGNITANGQTVFLNVDRASNVTISMVATALVGHNSTFEYSNNSTNGTDGNWYGVQAARSNANSAEATTGVLTATPVYGWEASVNAYKWIRARATAHTSGTAAYLIKQGTYATEPVPIIQVTGTQPVSGTVTANQGTTLVPTASIVSSAATTNGTVVKASAGTIYGGMVSNTGAAVAFLKLHNSATVTAGTTAVALTIPVPAGGTVQLNFGPQGMRYGTGICLSITGAAADNDTTAIALGQVKVNLSLV